MKRLKILGVLVLIAVIGIVLINSISSYGETSDMEYILGTDATIRDVSLKEYIILADGTIGQYFKRLQEGQYENAYNLLTPEYRAYVSLEAFTENVKAIDPNIYYVRDIVLKTQNMYEAFVELSDGETHEFLIIIKDEKFALVPEPFIEYKTFEDKHIKKDNVDYILKGYAIELERCVFDVEIINSKDEAITIASAEMLTANERKVTSNMEESIQIEPNTTVTMSIEFSTAIDFPSQFSIQREDEQKIRNYIFDL